MIGADHAVAIGNRTTAGTVTGTTEIGIGTGTETETKATKTLATRSAAVLALCWLTPLAACGGEEAPRPPDEPIELAEPVAPPAEQPPAAPEPKSPVIPA